MKRNLLFAVIAVFVGCIAGCSVLLMDYFYPRQYEKNDFGEYVNVNAKAPDTFPINEHSHFVIEHYYPDENRVLTENVLQIPALLGCKKDEVIAYLSDYTNHMSVEEKEQGLYSFELVSYQGQEIHLRKTYRKSKEDGFVAKSFNGEVVIMNSDEKTVYEYTSIHISTLPESLQEEVIHGYHITSLEELYQFLENYSS